MKSWPHFSAGFVLYHRIMAWGRRIQLLQSGVKAPDFRLPRLGGGEITLAEILAGGPALLAFFKVTCPVCQLTLPFLARIHSPAVAVYGISQNDAEDTAQFNREFGVTVPMLLDSEEGFEVSNAFGISSVPTLFLVEPEGVISRVVEGWQKKEIDWLGERAGVAAIRASDNVPAWKAG
jgi:peroxiredoxin